MEIKFQYNQIGPDILQEEEEITLSTTVQPGPFSGIIAYPGIIYGDRIDINESWNHMSVLLAYGVEDSDGWKKGIFKTDFVFRSYSIPVDTMMLIDQGHIVELDYDIDKVYRKYID